MQKKNVKNFWKKVQQQKKLVIFMIKYIKIG